MQGFIKLHRRLLTSAVFEDGKLLKTWVWCCLRACWEPYTLNDGRRLQRGQFATSMRRAALELNCTPATVKRHFDRLEKMQMIITQRETPYTVVSVCNYSVFQDQLAGGETPIDTPTDTPIDTPTDTRIDTRRRSKERKKKRKGGFVFSGSEKRKATLAKWSEYKGKHYTDQQKHALQESLDGLIDADIELKVNRAIASGWKGLGDLTPEVRDNPQPAKHWKAGEKEAAIKHDLKKRIKAAKKAGSLNTVKALKKEIAEYAG